MLDEKGFTALELVVVVAIAGILASIAIPNYLAYSTRAKLRGAENNLVADFQLARSRAIRANANVAVVFNADGLGYTVFEDFNNNWTRDADEGLIRSVDFPPGVQVNIPTTFTNNRMRFNSRGIPDGGFGSATLSNAEDSRRIVINIAGRIRTE